MGNPRHILPLIKADLGQQRPGRHKQDAFPLTRLYFRKNIAAQHRRRATAAAPARMGILRLRVKHFDPAVHMDAGNILSCLAHKIKQNFLPHHSQIASDDPVIVRWFPVKITEILQDCVYRRHRHCRPHVHGIAHLHIDDLSGGGSWDTRLKFGMQFFLSSIFQ